MVLGEQELGWDHQETPTALNNLAELIKTQGRYGEAEPLYVRALEASERVLGKDHPDTLSTQLNLVVALISTGHRDKALRALHRMDERLRRFVGARNLLMTLWPLNDRLAADFMKDFYAKWFENPKRHPVEALQETRLAWIRSKDPKRRDPAYWAPYVLLEGR